MMMAAIALRGRWQGRGKKVWKLENFLFKKVTKNCAGMF